MRNRTLSSGLERPASASGLRPITPSSYGGDKMDGVVGGSNGQNFVDFNPAGGVHVHLVVVAWMQSWKAVVVHAVLPA